MRLDPDHVRTLARAITTEDGDASLKVDMAAMRNAQERLSLWELGLLSKALGRAIAATRKSPEQRVLLALFAHREDGE